MSSKKLTRESLLKKGFFPEVLPPCFDSDNLATLLNNIDQIIIDREHNKRSSVYIKYNGTKHDGNRRNYGTANPIPYFSVCNFIANQWDDFKSVFNESQYCLDGLRVGGDTEERSVIISALNELKFKLSERISYAPFILKADIAQFFPSVYTHTIPWVIHGREQSKLDTDRKSNSNKFNALDWFIQRCQQGQTRGLIVGPDAFRVVAELISCSIDKALLTSNGGSIVGGVRHVDDFYLGVNDEHAASVTLSYLRDALQEYELQINDSKTKIFCSLNPIDDIWAQNLRKIDLRNSKENYSHLIDCAHEISQATGSQSAVKLALRRFDDGLLVDSDQIWDSIEPILQRILAHYSHCTDYVCLLLAKRFALGKSIDRNAWSLTIANLIDKHISKNQHHEICWLLWVSIVTEVVIDNATLDKIAENNNSHIKAMIIAAYTQGVIKNKPNIRCGNKLSTTDENWLHNLVAHSTGFSKADFSSAYAMEFKEISKENLNLLDFKKHIEKIKSKNSKAISASKYGYDVAYEEDSEKYSHYGDDDMTDDLW